MNLQTIREALKAAIEKIEGLNADDLRPTPNVPCVIVIPDAPFDLNMDFDGETWPKFRLLTLVPWVDTDDAQVQLDGYLATDGPSSVKQAVENDERLKQIVDSVHINELRSYSVIQMHEGGVEYLGAELICEVYAN